MSDKNLPEDEYISKTKRKAEADAAQALGKKLVALPLDKLESLALPEALFEAIVEAKRIKANSATRRQAQYIGRLMRDLDTAPIEEQLQRWEGKHAQENAKFHALERWRDRLLSDIDALADFLEAYPQSDRQQLRTLVRNAQAEQKADKAPKHQRALFKMIREIAEQV